MTQLTKELLVSLKSEHKTDKQIQQEFNIGRVKYEQLKMQCGFKKHHTVNTISDEPFADFALEISEEKRMKLYKGQRYDRG